MAEPQIVAAPAPMHAPVASVVQIPASVSEPQEHRQDGLLKPVRFTVYDRFIVAWPVIASGLLFSLWQWILPGYYPERFASTTWVILWVICTIAMGFNFNSKKALSVVLILAVVTLALTNLHMVFDILPWIFAIVLQRVITVSLDTMLVVSTALGIVYAYMLVACRLTAHWVVIPGKMVSQPITGKEDELPINATLNVKYDIRNVLIWFLAFGAGHLVVTTTDGKRELRYVLWAKKRDRQIEPFEAMPVTAAVRE